MKAFKSSRKALFLSTIPTISINDEEDILTKRSKFNFHYMDFSQTVGQRFEDWEYKQLINLLNTLKDYCGQPLRYWTTQSQRVGKRSHNVLEVYGNFPRNSGFKFPKHVPHEAEWARFRLGNLVRLIGFLIPGEFNGKIHKGTDSPYDCNTFYVVFLDRDHKFFITER